MVDVTQTPNVSRGVLLFHLAHKAQAEEETMDARRLRLDAGGGPLVAIQSSVPGAEEPEPLAAVLRQPPARKWPTTAEIVVPMGPFNRRVTTRRRTPARVWVFGLAMVGGAFVAFMFVWIAQRGNPPAFDPIEQQLQKMLRSSPMKDLIWSLIWMILKSAS